MKKKPIYEPDVIKVSLDEEGEVGVIMADDVNGKDLYLLHTHDGARFEAKDLRNIADELDRLSDK